MSKKLILVLLAVSFGLAMAPGQAWAQHPDLDVTFTVVWNDDINPYDIDLYVYLTEDEGVPLGIAGWLTPDAAFTVWTIHFNNIDEDNTEYVFTWDENGYDWVDPPPLGGIINWNNEEIIDGSECNLIE